jgi:hypothetical protein
LIFVDANILLYAEDQLCANHRKARLWWDKQLSGSVPVYLSWTVLNAFIRIGTNSRVYEHPLSLLEATARIQSWLNQPCTRIAIPTERHWDIFQELLRNGKAVGNLVTDAHLAALAIEYGCTLYSSDSDFSRFSKLKWKNPLT